MRQSLHVQDVSLTNNDGQSENLEENDVDAISLHGDKKTVVPTTFNTNILRVSVTETAHVFAVIRECSSPSPHDGECALHAHFEKRLIKTKKQQQKQQQNTQSKLLTARCEIVFSSYVFLVPNCVILDFPSYPKYRDCLMILSPLLS